MVKEAVTAPEQSYATAFWPENGAVAALPGRFIIQVRRRSVLSKASGEGPGGGDEGSVDAPVGAISKSRGTYERKGAVGRDRGGSVYGLRGPSTIATMRAKLIPVMTASVPRILICELCACVGGCACPPQACDAHGNKRSSGGDSFSLEIRGVASNAIQLQDFGDGSYLASYCVPSEGAYTLAALLQGHHIRGSPMSLTVYRCTAVQSF